MRPKRRLLSWASDSGHPLGLYNEAVSAVQLLLGHTKVDTTVRYLGVELEDALSIAESIDI